MSRKGRARRRQRLATPPLSASGLGTGEPGTCTQAPRWVYTLTPWLIALVTFAAFLPTLHNQFVNWDDYANFLDNPHYRGLGWSHLRWMWTAFHLGHYIPLTWMTFGLDYLLWGLKPLGYHLTSLLLHTANAVVFYFLTRRLLGLAVFDALERGQTALALAAGSAALLFALHPLRVESVAWVTERRDVLSGLFYLLAILVYLRACERGEYGRGWYWGAVGLCACALLSKSMAVSLPVVLLILDVYPLRRLGGVWGWWSEHARRVYIEKIPFVLLAAAASATAFLALSSFFVMTPLDQLSVLDRLAVSAYGLSFYLWKMIAPWNLSPIYELLRQVNPWAAPFILSYWVVVTITSLALALRRRWPGLLAAWLTYGVILLPVLGIFQNGYQIAADRYTYLAGLGWAILAGAGLLSRWHAPRFLFPALCVLVGFGVLTWNQARVWHDSARLWTHALTIDPNSSVAQYNLGAALAQQGKLAEAIEHYRQALRIQPNDASPHYNWGAALAQQGKLAEAIEHYRQALRIQPDNAAAHIGWGLALAQQGEPADAVEHYRHALRIQPHNALAHVGWGNALAQQGELPDAVQHYQKALEIRPDYAEAHANWGAALAQQGRLAEAIKHYRHALRIQPDNALAHYNWGNAFAQQGNLADAVEHYQKALQIRPDFVETLNNLGVTLARQGKPAEAIEYYQQALKIRPDYADARRNLSRALARQGAGRPR
jgi:tetratricopeptide (TPR) repeat protein